MWCLGFEIAAVMPADWRAGRFLGRIDAGQGPTPVLVQDGVVYDMSAMAPTVSQLLAAGGIVSAWGRPLGGLAQLGLGTRPTDAVRLLAPIDLQVVKASGVTFAISVLERVIEEAARGDYVAAAGVRARLEARIGGGIKDVVPGSAEAAQLKASLIEEGLWSQYLEVAIGPDAEFFTKGPVLASMG